MPMRRAVSVACRVESGLCHSSVFGVGRAPIVQVRFARGRPSGGLKIKPINENESFFRLKNTESVSEALKIIESNEHKKDYYHAAMMNHTHNGNISFVKAISEDMIKNNVAWDVKTYDLLFRTYGNRRDTVSILNLLEQMKSSNVEPDSHIYDTIITQFSFAKKHDQMLPMLEESIKTNQVCGTKSFQTVMGVMIDSRDFDKANRVLNLAKKVNVEGIKHLYDDLIQAYAREEDIKTIRKLIDEMQASGIYVRPFVLEMLKEYEKRDGNLVPDALLPQGDIIAKENEESFLETK